MLLPTMTYLEMSECLNADIPKLEYWKQKLYPKASKILISKRWYSEKVHVNNNQYIIFFYYDTDSYRDSVISYCILLHENERFAVQFMMNDVHSHYDDQFYRIPYVCLYTRHFFERYKERFLKRNDISYDETAGIFFSRNVKHTPIKIDDRINSNIEKYDDFHKHGYKIRDGFCFTMGGIQTLNKDNTPVACGDIYTTFLNNESLTQSQIEAINEEYQSCIELWKNLNASRTLE